MQTKLGSSGKYFYELNFIRAIACMCVLVVHVTASHYHVNEDTFNWLSLFLNQAFRFGTPLFAILSGFLLYNQAINKGFSLKKFFTSRFTKIGIPFVIWSIIYLLIRSYNFPSINNTDGGVKEFLFYFSLGKSYYHLYFIAIVVQFYLLFPILQLFKTKKWLISLTVISFYINFFYIQQPFQIGNGLPNQFIQDRAFLFYWIFYFFFGGLLVHYWKSIVMWVRNNTKFSVILGVIVILFMTYDYNTFGDSSSTRITNLINVPIMLTSLTGVYFLMDRWSGLREKISNLGNLSMGIYLVHPLVIYVLQTQATWIMDRTRWIPLAFLVTLFVSIIIVKAIYRIPLGQYVVTVASPKKSKVNVKEEKVKSA